MNEENLKSIDIDNSNEGLKSLDNSNLINIPNQLPSLNEQKNSLQSNNLSKEHIISKLPDWNIEPPLEIKRGER